jgi:hypothetical protein
MESDEIRRALREADRAEAAPWTDYPPTPRWYPPATGAWAAGLTVALAGLEGGDRGAAVLVLLAVECCFLAWYLRYRGGAMPTGWAPREFRRAIALFLGAIALIAVAVSGLALLAGAWAGAVLALVAVTGVVTWYERAYADAARRARERLS